MGVPFDRFIEATVKIWLPRTPSCQTEEYHPEQPEQPVPNGLHSGKAASNPGIQAEER